MSNYTVKSIESVPTLIERYYLEDFGGFKTRYGYSPIIDLVVVQVEYWEEDDLEKAKVHVSTTPLGYDTTSKGVRDKRSTQRYQNTSYSEEHEALEDELALQTLERFLTAFPQFRGVEVSGL